jgi:hypothetical protein
MQSAPSLKRLNNNEESQLPNQAMPAGGNSQFRNHHRLRTLQNQVVASSLISFPHLRQNSLLGIRHALPSDPTPTHTLR